MKSLVIASLFFIFYVLVITYFNIDSIGALLLALGVNLQHIIHAWVVNNARS